MSDRAFWICAILPLASAVMNTLNANLLRKAEEALTEAEKLTKAAKP